MRQKIKFDAKFVGEREVYAITGIAVSTLQKYRLRGGGPPFLKLPTGRIRYSLADLDAWLSRCTRGGGHAEGR